MDVGGRWGHCDPPRLEVTQESSRQGRQLAAGSCCCCSLGCEILALEPKCPRALGLLYSDRGMEASMGDNSHWLRSSVSPGVQLLWRVSKAHTFPGNVVPQTLDSRGTFPNLWNQESRLPAPQLLSLISRGPLLSSTLAPFLGVPQFPVASAPPVASQLTAAGEPLRRAPQLSGFEAPACPEFLSKAEPTWALETRL